MTVSVKSACLQKQISSAKDCYPSGSSKISGAAGDLATPVWLIENSAHSLEQFPGSKGLIDQMHGAVQHSMMNDGVIGVSRHVEDLHMGMSG